MLKRTVYIIFLALLLSVALTSAAINPVFARAETTTPPPGFELVDYGPGVELFRKEYSGGTPDFVQVIDLSREAQVTFLHSSLADSSGENPRFTRQTLQQGWDAFAAADRKALCLANGAFFSTDEDPTPLAFPLKAAGQVISRGYGAQEFPDQKLMLEVWPDHARISPYTPDSFSASSAPEILIGLSEDADKNRDGLVGRTFAGVQDADGNGLAEIVLVFSSKTSRQADAAAVLRSFGAQQVIMFDGGDSAQLMCKNNPYVYSDRSIPQTIAVSSGTSQPLQMTVAKQPNFPVVIEGETAQIELTLRNDGTETWLAGEVALVNLHNDWGAGERLELPSSVAPGETVNFSWVTTAFPKWGVFTSEWDIARGNQTFASKPIVISVIVLPEQLADKKTELENQVREWGRQQLENVEQLVLEWIQARVREGFDKICPASASLPLLVAGIGVWRLKRRKSH